MTSSSASTRFGARRLLPTLRMAWAAILLLAPAKLIGVAGGQADRDAVVVVRVLGARHAIQAVIEMAIWPSWSRAGSAVDAAHSITAAALAATDPRQRRVAAADSVIAAAFATASHIAIPTRRGR